MYINKLACLVVLPALVVTLLLLCAGKVTAQITVFQSGFEYGNDPADEPFIVEPADLNEANEQVGLWSGDEFPEGQGDILFLPDAVGFIDNPVGGRALLLDRPTGDVDGTRPNAEPNSDFTGSYFADLDKTISLLGAQVSFDVGTRRTAGDNQKDYDIIGRDSNGAESFHLRVGTNNNGGERLGIVTDAGNTLSFDLTAVVGNDMPADLDNLGGPPFATNDEIGSVAIRLGATGYSVDFVHVSDSTANFNAYTTDLISYNGQGVDLAQIEFTYEASTANGRNSGYLLDNILVTGFEGLLLGDFHMLTIYGRALTSEEAKEHFSLGKDAVQGKLLPGDFNDDGVIDVADFNLLADNFGTGASFFQGDSNGDGSVNLLDYVEFRDAFNAAQGQAAVVPEPCAFSLLLISLLLLPLRTTTRPR